MPTTPFRNWNGVRTLVKPQYPSFVAQVEPEHFFPWRRPPHPLSMLHIKPWCQRPTTLCVRVITSPIRTDARLAWSTRNGQTIPGLQPRTQPVFRFCEAECVQATSRFGNGETTWHAGQSCDQTNERWVDVLQICFTRSPIRNPGNRMFKFVRVWTEFIRRIPEQRKLGDANHDSDRCCKAMFDRCRTITQGFCQGEDKGLVVRLVSREFPGASQGLRTSPTCNLSRFRRRVLSLAGPLKWPA